MRELVYCCWEECRDLFCRHVREGLLTHTNTHLRHRHNTHFLERWRESRIAWKRRREWGEGDSDVFKIVVCGDDGRHRPEVEKEQAEKEHSYFSAFTVRQQTSFSDHNKLDISLKMID